MRQPAVTRYQLAPFAALSASYFAHIGFFNPYLPLWLKDLGLSITVIGLLTAVQAATRVLAPYGWGWLSDHTGERVKLLRFCAGAALLCSAGLLVQGGVVWLAFVLLLMFIHTSAMMPMSEAALAHLVSTGGDFDSRRYGRVRLWGSLGFLVTVFVAGAWFEHQGMQSFPSWAVGSLVALNLSVWWLPKQREPAHHSDAPLPVMDVLRQPRVQWFFATVFFHVLSHIGIYVFFSLYLDSLGYSKTMIGVLWAVSVLAEIVWFFTQGRWLPKFSLANWLLLCAAAMVLRMALTSSPNSSGFPRHSLNPTGFPPLSSRSCAMNSIMPSGVEKAEWVAGLLQSPTGGKANPRASAIAGVILALGSMPPWAGFAPWLSLSSIMAQLGRMAFSLNMTGSKTRLRVPCPHPKYPVPTFQVRSPPPSR